MAKPTTAETVREVVLVGGGHAHVQVLRRFAMRPPAGVHLTLVVDRPDAVYSGMIPGVVAGDYELADAVIDVVPLARRARARVLIAAATRVDPARRRIEIEGRPPVGYDLASLNVGSTVWGRDLPGVAEHAVATRPIGELVPGLDARLEALASEEPAVIVVGAGAAGCELAFTLQARLRAAGLRPRITLLTKDAGPGLQGGPRINQLVRDELRRRSIQLRSDVAVAAVEKDAVRLRGSRGEAKDERVPADLVLWAAGAAPPQLLGASALPLDAQGYVRVDECLRVEGFADLFAVGDCASVAGRRLPKAGVYAVREGAVLARSLERVLAGGAPRRYRPQGDFLTLLNLGEGRALGGKWGRAFAGRSVWRLKDRIDRRFMRRFQVLRSDGVNAPGFPSPDAMGMEEMPCGGCAAKLDAVSLERALARLPKPPHDSSVLLGLAEADDVAAVRTRGGDVLLASVDGFRAFADDAFLVGRVAALNAASDLHAKGGRPEHALAWVGLPEQAGRPGDLLAEVLAGVLAAFDALEVSLVGGHTTLGDELFVGLTVTGSPAGRHPLVLSGARPGDRLVLTKPLGSGVVLAADMRGLATGATVQALHRSLLRSNAAAARVAVDHGAHAATDVSGFGLARHAAELARASGLRAHIDVSGLPALPGALALLEAGVRSTFHAQNRAAPARVESQGPAVELSFDPQTCGGLLLAFASERLAAARAALRDAGVLAATVGRLEAASDPGPDVVLGAPESS